RVSSADVKALADLVHKRASRSGSRVAFVLPGDLAFGLGRIFESRVDGAQDRRRRVVRSWDAALDWMRQTPH
ncbi:MAG TPA: hypothetical protein VLA56_03600, partial [Pseudomonadales bacterium]|nr:hypothetical protein [Pseudomonadales bacterium]